MPSTARLRGFSKDFPVLRCLGKWVLGLAAEPCHSQALIEQVREPGILKVAKGTLKLAAKGTLFY